MKNGCIHWIINCSAFFVLLHGCSNYDSDDISKSNNGLISFVVGAILVGVSSYLYREPNPPKEEDKNNTNL